MKIPCATGRWLIIGVFYLCLNFIAGCKAPEQCQSVSGQIPWAYCVDKTDPSPNSSSDILYLFHPYGDDEHSWKKSFQPLAAAWSAAHLHSPTIVTIEFRPQANELWLLIPSNRSPSSGKLDFFLNVILPAMERSLGAPKHRFLLGQSMGGFNALELYFRRPDLFTRAAVLCPMLPGLSPWASDNEIATYAQDHQISASDVQLLVAAMRDQVPSEMSWEEVDPLRLAIEPVPTPLYLSWNEADTYAFNESSVRLSELLDSEKSPLISEALPGGHCANLDYEAVANFLAAGFSR